MSDVQVPLVLCVGEMNPYGADPYFALYYLPREASGNRLRCILGLTDEDYMRYCARTNLCRGSWDLAAARLEAARLLEAAPEHCFLLLGARVRQAFAGPEPLRVASSGGRTLVGLHHPSGRCRKWTSEVVAELRVLLGRFVPAVPWGRNP